MAGHHRVDGHQLADRQSCHVWSELSNPADGLVSHDLARVAATVLAGIAVKVRAADAGGDHLDHCLARPRHRIGPFLNRDVVVIAQYQRSHVPTWEHPVRPPRRLSLLVRYVVGVDLVQVTSLDLVGLLEERRSPRTGLRQGRLRRPGSTGLHSRPASP